MNTSTVQDIQDNIEELKTVALALTVVPTDDEDWWHIYTIEDKEYDLNVFDWELPDGSPVQIVTAHPITQDDTGYGQTDMNNYVRLITQPKKVKA